MAKYILKRAILGGEKPQQAGEVIELTEEQAAHPLYRERVQPLSAEAEPEAPKAKK